MSPNRFIALLVVLSIVTILVASNWSVGLPLSFLGMQARSLPLGIWMLLGFATGLSLSLGLQLLQYPQPANSESPRPKSPPRRAKVPNRTTQKPQPTDGEEDDWDVEPPPVSEDWDFEDEEAENPVRDDAERSYETKREPTSKNVSGSVYSYSYRQPQDTGVGKSEAVRDANYRVIRPPVREPVDETSDEDDWGFDFDDEEQK